MSTSTCGCSKMTRVLAVQVHIKVQSHIRSSKLHIGSKRLTAHQPDSPNGLPLSHLSVRSRDEESYNPSTT